MVEVEVQNESDQTQLTLRFAAVPRIGEGVRLLDRDGVWASFDVLDVWYQRAPYGDIWLPYIHVRRTGEAEHSYPTPAAQTDLAAIDTGAE